MVVIRLARGGRTHKPVYTIVATDSRNARDGRFLERLGQYDPSADDGQVLRDVKTEAIAAWVNKGATLSTTLASLFKKHKIALK